MPRTIRMCPSILNADQDHLQEEIERVASASDLLHLDVMDNIFVPNQTFTFQESAKIIESSPIPVDAHLMIANPDADAFQYAKVGAASVTFHLEASTHPRKTIEQIRTHGARASLAIKPSTSLEAVSDLLDDIDMLLIMTVEPGFGGQKFMVDLMPKVAQAREWIDRSGRDTWLQVDGGISLETIEIASRAGADAFVAGSAVYKASSPAQMLHELRKLAVASSAVE